MGLELKKSGGAAETPERAARLVFPPTAAPHGDRPVLTVCVGTQVSSGPGSPVAGPCSSDAVGLLAGAPGAGQLGTP